MDMKKVIVSGLAIDKEREHPVVLLKYPESEEDRVLPIWIGPAEASSIFSALSGKSFSRPLTHDLMKIIIDVLEAEVRQVEITGIQNDTYFARLVLKRGDDIFYIDARPSDSIALALRCKAPIYLDPDLFSRYSRKMTVPKDDELGNIDPDEFNDFDL